MNARRTAPNTPVDQYARYGNQRPPIAKLLAMQEYVSKSNKPSVLVVNADMCLDLALADDGQSQRWLAEASLCLDDVIAGNEAILNAGYSLKAAQTEVAVKAHIRRSELANWEMASANRSLSDSYATTLFAAQSLLPLIVDYPMTVSKATEFMPVLLGARARYRQDESGWCGRLALYREDCRAFLPPGKNPNWDTGVFKSDSAAEFVQPPVRIQMKTDSTAGQSSYRRDGVICISARRQGFDDPASIIASCLIEHGVSPEPDYLDDIPVLEPDELDRLTLDLETTIRSQIVGLPDRHAVVGF
jgi:hypothetical protein